MNDARRLIRWKCPPMSPSILRKGRRVEFSGANCNAAILHPDEGSTLLLPLEAANLKPFLTHALVHRIAEIVAGFTFNRCGSSKPPSSRSQSALEAGIIRISRAILCEDWIFSYQILDWIFG